MIRFGEDAIEYLINKIDEEDTSSSSHWNKYHSKLKFVRGEFLNLNGFGGNAKPRSFFKSFFHKFFQRPLILIGQNYPHFESLNTIMKKIISKQNRTYDIDIIRQVITLSFLKFKLQNKKIKNYCVIGDGFGSMTSLIASEPDCQSIILFNLNKTLLVDLWYLKLDLGVETFNSRVALVDDEKDIKNLNFKKSKFPLIVAVMAKNSNFLKNFEVDLALNLVSMQEMDYKDIKSYFIGLRKVSKKRNLYFYCCDRDMKTLPDKTEITFDNYPW